MALFKLLCSIFLVSLARSAPVEVSTGHQIAGTVVSDVGKDVTHPTRLDELTSSARPSTFPPTDQGEWAAGNKESEPLKQSDPVPTDVAKEEQTTSQSSDALPLERDSSETGVIQISDNKSQQTGNIDQQSDNPEVDPPTIDAGHQKASETTPPFDRQPEHPQENDGAAEIPNPPDSEIKDIPSVFEDPNIPLQLSERDLIPGNIESPQEPYDDRPIDDQTPPPFGEDSGNDGQDTYPQPSIDEESAIPEDVRQPFESPQEEEVAEEIPPESIQEDDTEIQNELQNNDEADIGNNPPSVDKNPTEIAQEDSRSPFDAYDYPGDKNEESPESPPFELSDIPAEQVGDPGFPISITETPEEMVVDRGEVPAEEEAHLPEIKMADDGVEPPPVLAVIQIGQVQPQYGNE